MSKELVAKCGAKTGADGKPFKSSQGVIGHERMCSKCQQIKNSQQSSTENSSTQKPTNQGCQHNYRLLSTQEKAYRNQEGKTLGEMGFDAVCTKCGSLQ